MANDSVKFYSEDFRGLITTLNKFNEDDIIKTVNKYSKYEDIIPDKWESKAASKYREDYTDTISNDVSSLIDSTNNLISKINEINNGFVNNSDLLKEAATKNQTSDAVEMLNNFGITDGDDDFFIKKDDNDCYYGEYIVKSGDTLGDIAKKMNTTYEELAKANGIKDANVIQPGDVIQWRTSVDLKDKDEGES